MATGRSSLTNQKCYEPVLNHYFQKLGFSDAKWQHSNTFISAIKSVGKSDYFINNINEATALGRNPAVITRYDPVEGA